MNTQVDSTQRGGTSQRVEIEPSQARIWATEETLKNLLSRSTFTNDILLEFAQKSLSADSFKRLTDYQLKQSRTQNEKVTGTIEDAARRAELEEEQHAERYEYAVANLKDSLMGSLGDIGSSLDSADPSSIFRSLSSRLDYAARQFDGFNTTLAKTVVGLKIAAAVLNISYDRINQLNTGYVLAYSSGVKFADGLSGLNQMVGESGISMQEFVGIMNKFSQSFNVLGSRRVEAVSREFRTLTNNGSTLTMTLAQSQEGLMAYTDILRMSGRLQRTSNRDIAMGAKSYLESINELSYASGRAREELMASTRNALAKPEFQAFMATLNDGAKASLEQGITSLAAYGEELQSTFSSFIQAGLTGGTAAMFKNNEALYMLANQTGQMSKMFEIIDLVNSGQDATQAMAEFTEGIKNSNLVSTGQLARMAQFDPMFADMNRVFGSLNIEANNLVSAQKQLAAEAAAAGLSIEEYKAAQKNQADRMLAANSQMQIAMTGVESAFKELLLGVVYPILIPGMKVLGTTVSFLTTILSGLLKPLTMLSDAISGLLSPIIGQDLGGIAGLAGGVGAGVLGYKALQLGGNKLGISRMLPDVLKGAKLPGMPGLGAAGDAIGGIGRGVGGLGRGVGDSVAGIMEGIARGFKAFGDPKVLLGIAGIAGLAGSVLIAGKAFQEFAIVSWEDMSKAGVTIVALGSAAALAGSTAPLIAAGGAALGAAIAAIGAGLAGAAWLLGGTLPTLAEGIRAFTDIDGANLEKVGLGMLGIGGGLIAIGAGEVANAVGSFVGWIGSLFGAEDPIDKLKRFGELGEPLGKAGPALDAFGTAFLNATAKMNAATVNDSVETSMEQIMRILEMDASGTFGGEPPIIGQINSLADAIGRLNSESAELSGVVSGPSTTASSPDMLSPSDLQKRTLAFYDNQKSSNASIIELLRAANEKLDTINTSVVDDTNRTIRALKASGNNVN